MGYIKDEKGYKDETIKRLREQIKRMNPHEALKTTLEDKELYEGNEEMDGVEIYKFYKDALRKIMPHFFEKKVHMFNCYRELEEGKKEGLVNI